MAIKCVSTTGNNAWTGDVANPWLTLAYAATHISAGDTLYIRGGTYHEDPTFAVNGTSGSRITIDNYESELAIIDGDDTLPVGDWNNPLVKVTGSYTTLRDISIKNSNGVLLVLGEGGGVGTNIYAINITGNRSRETGMVAGGTGCMFDGCSMTGNGWGSGIGGQVAWGSAICTVGVNTTIQNCLSHDNIGEGINAYSSATGAIIQDNITYDNKSICLYLDSTNGALVQRNLCYQSPSWRLNWARGITIGAETGTATDLTIINNLVLGTFVNLEIDGNVTSLADSIIAYNTFVNAWGSVGDGYNMGVYLRPITWSNVIFKNNITIEESGDKVPIYVAASHSGLTFSNNGWNKTPTSGAQGTGDVTGDLKLSKTGTWGAGTLTGEYFKILSNSPCINAGVVLAGIADDYFKTARGSSPDIGAHEYQVGLSPIGKIREGMRIKVS